MTSYSMGIGDSAVVPNRTRNLALARTLTLTLIPRFQCTASSTVVLYVLRPAKAVGLFGNFSLGLRSGKMSYPESTGSCQKRLVAA